VDGDAQGAQQPTGAELEGQPLPDREGGAGSGAPTGSTDWDTPQGAQEPAGEAPRYGDARGSVIPPDVQEQPSAIPGEEDRSGESRRDQLWARLDAEREGASGDDADAFDREDETPHQSPQDFQRTAPGLPGDPGSVLGPP